MTGPVIGFIGFGEAAQCFSAQSATQGINEILVFCDGTTNSPPYSQAFRAVVAARGATPLDSLDPLLMRADVVISAVVVATAATVGRAIASGLRPGMLGVDTMPPPPMPSALWRRW